MSLRSTLSKTHKNDSSDRVQTVAQPLLYLVLEGARPLAGGVRLSLAKVREVRFGRGRERVVATDGDAVNVTVPDPRMSGRHACLRRDGSGWVLEDAGSTNGTFVGDERVTSRPVDRPTQFLLGTTVFLFDPAEEVAPNLAPFVDETHLKGRPQGLATIAPALEASLAGFIRIALSDLPVLLLGETGAGKEILARAVHSLSRRQGAFVPVNCGALTPTLVESQLFGYVKGAFSGALRDEVGLVRASAGGTLFLDEVGELPSNAQATLLRVLQEKEVLPVGATKPVPVDLRVVAATLQPIDQSPTFRPDLYARLSAYVHRLTPLRERAVDVGLIVADLLPRVAKEDAADIRLTPELATALVAHSWPRNVRELEHVLSVAVVRTEDGELHTGDVGGTLGGHVPSTPPTTAQPSAAPLGEADLKLKDELHKALVAAGGNVSVVSRSLGKTRMQIHRWMKRFGIDAASYRK